MSAGAPGAEHPLYPPREPYRTGFLPVSDIHRIYFEESGNPNGMPAVLLHGGPGYGTEPSMRRFFDPRKYRLVLFDQRGCGKSRPHACLTDNTTWHLLADIEALRVHLGIERWLVFGGSWGSTLALAYAVKFPSRVTGLIVRGIFLLRRSELEWFYLRPDGAGSLFPDRWDEFVAPIPKRERGDILRAYYKRLTSASATVRNRAASAWSIWEAATSYLHPHPEHIAAFRPGRRATALAKIECHYFLNGGFFPRDAYLLHEAKRIRRIPGIIVHGRYDVVCPMRSAWDLHQAWPEAKLRIVADAGHASLETGIARELVRATDEFATRPRSRQL